MCPSKEWSPQLSPASVMDPPKRQSSSTVTQWCRDVGRGSVARAEANLFHQQIRKGIWLAYDLLKLCDSVGDDQRAAAICFMVSHKQIISWAQNVGAKTHLKCTFFFLLILLLPEKLSALEKQCLELQPQQWSWLGYTEKQPKTLERST